MYPEPGANHFALDAAEVAADRGAFLIAYLGEMPVGCGAVRLIDEETAEIKRMYVAPRWRGLGFSKRVLRAVERHASRLGAKRIVLETGVRQAEAISLYEGNGYARMAPFGEYIDSPLSLCMTKPMGR